MMSHPKHVLSSLKNQLQKQGNINIIIIIIIIIIITIFYTDFIGKRDTTIFKGFFLITLKQLANITRRVSHPHNFFV